MPETLNPRELLQEIEKLKSEINKMKVRKKYGLIWEEKNEQVVLDCQNKVPVLREVKNRVVETDKNKPVNILIEGDNYHSLFCLNYTHKGKVDVIYIDPPYNTGNKDFIYNDHYVDKDDSYRHSKWLSFMNKRLRLARYLLKDDGIIFISIDDNEQANLKILMDKIFGEKNFIDNLLWLNKEGGGSSDSKYFKRKEEYILVYGRIKDEVTIEGLETEENSSYAFKDEFAKERGRYKLIKLNSFSIQYSKSLDYPIKLPNGDIVHPSENGKKGCWRWSIKKYEWGLKNNFIEFRKNQDGKLWVYTKQYFKIDYNGNPTIRKLPPLSRIDNFSSTRATKDLENIMNNKVFNYPKPYQLISYLLKISTNKNSLIMDFMAGSGTTGHAVLELNKEDGGNRKFILCTNNENKIAEDVCYPRVKKVIKGYQNSKGKKVAGMGGNLKYFKTDLIDTGHLNNITDEKKIKLTYQADEMIAMRENTFDEVEKNNWWQIFCDSAKNKYTAIYFTENKIKLPTLIEKLEKLDKPTALYIFSWSKNEYKNEFAEYKNIRVEDIPEPIIEVYKEINKL